MSSQTNIYDIPEALLDALAEQTGSPDSDARQQARELLAAVPDYIHAQRRLNESHHLGFDRIRNQVETASRFNALVRRFARRYPTVRASALHRCLLDMAIASLPAHHLQVLADEALHTTIRGAQHELAFTQIVESTGRKVVSANLDEDVHGFDLEIQGRHGYIKANVKAGHHELRDANGTPHPFVIRGDVAIVHSTIRDEELDDHFFLDSELAAEHAPHVDEILHAAERALHA